jgi:hypothetical protein
MTVLATVRTPEHRARSDPALQEHLASDHAGNDEFIVQLEPLAGIALARVGRLDEAEATLTRAVDRSAAAGNSYCAAIAWAGQAMVAAARGEDTSRATEVAAELLGGLGIVGIPPVARRI